MNFNLKPNSPKEAIEIQKQLKSLVEITPFDGQIQYIAGSDISFNRFSDIGYAVVLVFSFPDFTLVEKSLVVGKLDFPYISGLLSFREIPLLLEAYNNLKIKPDLLVVDGQGIAHPRRLGIASHFGLVIDKPTIGSAKSVLVGKYQEPELIAGSWSEMIDKDEVVGAAFRSKFKTNPIFISPGHKIDLLGSVEIIRQCLKGYRIPEPTRQAHIAVNEFRVQNGKSV